LDSEGVEHSRLKNPELINSICRSVQSELAEFELLGLTRSPIPLIEFRLRGSRTPSVYLTFYKVPLRMRIGVTVSWSLQDRNPLHLVPMAVVSIPRAEIAVDKPTAEGEFRFLASCLWNPESDGTFRIGANPKVTVPRVVAQLRDPVRRYVNQLDPTRPGGLSAHT
jgi:hypothetical protein